MRIGAMVAAAAMIGIGPALFAQPLRQTPQIEPDTPPGGKPEEAPPITLTVGDTAPRLAGNVTWLRGEAIDTWKPGHIYVVDFWATWCGPCIESIPHLNAIAKQYKDDALSVVGVAIFPKPGAADPAQFLRGKGSIISYSVAQDFGNSVAEKFMQAAGRNSIPTVMVVDRAGKVAWIGNPLGEAEDLDRTLKLLVAGTFDPVATAARKKEADILLDKANQLARANNWDDSMKVIDAVVALDSSLFGKYAVMKYTVLHVRLGKLEEAKEYGRAALAGPLADQPERLNELAWFIVDPTKPVENRDLELAELASQRAAELTLNKDGPILDTLAAVQFARGDVANAIRNQRRALELTGDPATQAEYLSRLRQYQSASRQ